MVWDLVSVNGNFFAVFNCFHFWFSFCSLTLPITIRLPRSLGLGYLLNFLSLGPLFSIVEFRKSSSIVPDKLNFLIALCIILEGIIFSGPLSISVQVSRDQN